MKINVLQQRRDDQLHRKTAGPDAGEEIRSDMTPNAALAKLMILLTAAGYDDNKWSAEVVKWLFQRNLLGEMTEVS